MADFNFPRKVSDIRQSLAEIRARAHQCRRSDEKQLEIPSEGDGGETGKRGRKLVLLDAVGAHALLTTVEDGFETMLDVLGEMESLALARCRCDGATIAQKMEANCSLSGAASASASELTTPSEACHCKYLGMLQRELRDLVENTRFDGMPLLDARYPPPPLFIDLPPDTAMHLALTPPGRALESAVSVHVAALTPNLLARALADIEESVDRLAELRSRLAVAVQEQSLSPRRGSSAAAFLFDEASARAQLSDVGRRISEDAFEAVLAQANAEQRLVDLLYRHCSANALTRIYPIAAGLEDEQRAR